MASKYYSSVAWGGPPSGTDAFAHPGANPAELTIAFDEKIICFDVEAVATGVGHNDRKACRVSAVDRTGHVLLDEIIAVPAEEIFNPLTLITGLTAADIAQQRLPFEAVQASLKALCGPEAVLVGQGIDGDIKWMGLEEGVDYARSVDIAEHFRVWNPKFGNWLYFSLARLAFGLLGQSIQDGVHSSVEDANVSMALFREYLQGPRRRGQKNLRAARKKLFSMTCRRQFPKAKDKPIWTPPVCSYMFDEKKCFCGQPSSSSK